MPATPPADSDLESFLSECGSALPGTKMGEPRKRCIGSDLETSDTICKLVIAGDNRH